MIVHVMRRAQQSGIGPVYVACDDARIEDAVRVAGGRAVRTRPDHPSGSDRIYEALLAIDPKGQYDVVVNVQGDVPTVEPQTIRAVLGPLVDPAVDIATLACLIHNPKERSDTSVVKPVLHFISKTSAHATDFTRAPKAAPSDPLYHHIGIYAYRRAALARFVSLSPSPRELAEKLEQLRALDNGMRVDAAIVEAVPLGVDTPEHLEFARKLLAK